MSMSIVFVGTFECVELNDKDTVGIVDIHMNYYQCREGCPTTFDINTCLPGESKGLGCMTNDNF